MGNNLTGTFMCNCCWNLTLRALLLLLKVHVECGITTGLLDSYLWIIVHGGQKIESVQKINASRG